MRNHLAYGRRGTSELFFHVYSQSLVAVSPECLRFRHLRSEAELDRRSQAPLVVMRSSSLGSLNWPKEPVPQRSMTNRRDKSLL
ncbi:hypothetical protein F2Q69_00046046 [Brassica cretica]|uniref:Uncharacterized protein n=1 Tax=Brassica cretica TaxID=69181 RepID=A0A8S9Q7A1_BRACR|nr:hypothetical protein F2Q69_00046046 [Brassica cretica]